MEESNIPTENKKNVEAYGALIELDNKERSFKSKAGYYQAYALSVFLPPIGIYYFIKYLFLKNESGEDVKAGLISLGLTLASLLLTIWATAAMFGTVSHLTPNQGGDMLKQYSNPDNQKQMKDLFQ